MENDKDNVIILKPREMMIKTVNTDRGEEEVVQIKGSIAFDDSFIAECRSKGVKDIVEIDKETTE